MRWLGGTVDTDDANRTVIDAEIEAEDTPASRTKMINKRSRVLKIEAGAKDDEDTLRMTCAGHMEKSHARPDRAPPRREIEDGCWVCRQLSLCDDGAVGRLLPQPTQDSWKLGRRKALGVEQKETKGRGGRD